QSGEQLGLRMVVRPNFSKRTEPSAKQNCTPPVWRLLNVATPAPGRLLPYGRPGCPRPNFVPTDPIPNQELIDIRNEGVVESKPPSVSPNMSVLLVPSGMEPTLLFDRFVKMPSYWARLTPPVEGKSPGQVFGSALETSLA